MELELYEKIKKYKSSGKMPEGSRWAQLRFKNHYEDWVAKNNELYFLDKLVVTKDKVHHILAELYKDPNTTSNGLHSFFDIVKQKYYGIKFSEVQDFLKNCESYQLYKPIQPNKIIKPIIRSEPKVYVQADTIAFDKSLTHWNHGYSHALTCIDIFSKKLWVFPLKHNSAAECAQAFKKVINDCFPSLKTVHTDNGSEFKNEFDKLLKDNNISHHWGKAHVPQGQGQIERANKTIKSYLTQYMQKYNTKIWASAIPIFLNNYNNNRIHSTTREVPDSIFNSKDSEKIEEVKDNIKNSIRGTLAHNKIINPKIKIGDSVRLLKSAIDPKVRAAQLSGIGQQAKKFKAQWTKEIYKIQSISYRGGVKKIKVEDLDILLNINEIQKIDLEKLFKINLEKDDLENYGVDNSSFTCKINLKKSQGNNIIPPMHQLREQKKINYA